MGRHTTGAVALVAAALALSLVAVGCSGSDDGGGSGGDEGPVAVSLQEFAIGAIPATVAAGSVTFDVANEGPNDVHEFVVIKTDLAPEALPTDTTGAVDEAGEGIEPVDEIEDIPVGETQSLTVDLAAGSYVLICNIYDETEQESHYQEGMRAGFTVE